MEVDDPQAPGSADMPAVEDPGVPKKPSRVLFMVACAVPILAAAGIYVWLTHPNWLHDTANYAIAYDVPAGWVKLPVNELTLFRYKHPDHDIYLQGFQDQMVNEQLTDPELDADGLAKYYLDVTNQNLPEWQGERLSDYGEGDVKFSILRRWKPGKLVFLAFAKKGNTTLGVSMYANEESIPKAEDELEVYKQFLKSVRLTPTTYR